MTTATPLARILARRIAETGPMTIADYMAEALLHPDHGYYATRPAIGAAGDFTTAPEISQIFGELVGLWVAAVWMDQRAPAAPRLVELGPGRGTMMADMLRAMAVVPDFLAAATIHLVEASAVRRDEQRRTLAQAHPNLQVRWHATLDDLPDGPLFLIANEFFDALPIRQFQRRAGRWHERMVTLDETGALCFRLAPDATASADLSGNPARDAAQENEIAEISPAAAAVATTVARRIAASGGGALVVDYGYAGAARRGGTHRGDTFQAVRDHRPTDPLAEPGFADLTAHVDFNALARAAGAEGARVVGPAAQGAFLRALGIEERLNSLARNAGEPTAAELRRGVDRLVSPAAMGDLFKAMAIVPRGRHPVPGFIDGAGPLSPPIPAVSRE